MRRLGILFVRELRAYFLSPVTWVVLTLGWFLFGLISWSNALHRSGGDLLAMTWYAATQSMYLQILLVPLLTMRLLSEEKRTGTLEMLVTAPVRDHEIVLAKFFAAFVVNALLWASLPLYSAIMRLSGGEPDWGPVVSAYVAMLGVSAIFIALGLFASALSPHQMMAGFVAVVLIVGAIFLPALAEQLPEGWTGLRSVLASGNLWKQIEEGARGLLDMVHVTYQLAICGLFLLFTVRALEVRKWA